MGAMIGIFLVIMCFFCICMSISNAQNEKERRETQEQERQNKIKKYGAYEVGENFVCKSGLPSIMEKTCDIAVAKDGVLIVSGNQEISLRYDKICNVAIVHDTTEVEKVTTETKSNLGKALVGGALFGVTGAVVGAASKPKVKTTVSTETKIREIYFVINYIDKNNEMQTLTFTCGVDSRMQEVKSAIEMFIPNQQQRIEL